MRLPLLSSTLAVAQLASAISLTIDSPDSIKSAASTAAWGLVNLYPGNETGQIPGTLDPPYYWWECGAMFGALINYWYYTGDSTYNELVTEGMQFQVGPYDDYMPPNQTKDEGNDDQVFWGFAAMQAAEYRFPNPPSNQPGWLELAQGVFNSQATRWDNATCNGGLRWQIFSLNEGYDYKNSPSNAGFMNLASHLYAYTGNTTYASWVDAEWGWMTGVGTIAANGSVFDGAFIDGNCTNINPQRYSYSYGMVINTCATMYNITGDDIWQQRMLTVWNASLVFFDDNKVMQEIQCLEVSECDTDELSFKAYFSRFLAASGKLVPSFWEIVQPYLQASATAAAEQCDGTGQDGNTQACGYTWPAGTAWDHTTGIGQQMAALEVIQVNLSPEAKYPVTAKKGGISTGNSAAGSNGNSVAGAAIPMAPITTGDRAGAWILTLLIVVLTVGSALLLVK